MPAQSDPNHTATPHVNPLNRTRQTADTEFSRQSGRNRWYPSHEQLKDPAAAAAAFKQVLDQFYALQDSHADLAAKINAPTATTSGPPAGSGPTDSQLLGLHVAPIDTATLADGATLKFNKASGNFEFS